MSSNNRENISLELNDKSIDIETQHNKVEEATAEIIPNDLTPVDEFDEILEVIGSKGYFQKVLLYTIVCPMTAILPLMTYNILFMHNELDHWCYSEETKSYNETQLQQWKEINLPLVKGVDGSLKFSSCQMYGDQNNYNNETRLNNIIECQNGWSYDTSELKSSINSDYDWICSEQHYTTTFYTVLGVGGFIGALIFGLLADKYGRKPIFFIALFIFIFFRIICLFVPSHFILYLALMTISSTGFQQIYSTPTIVIAELCDDEFRSWTYSFLAIVWVSGMAALPYVSYLCQTWFLLGCVTTFPCLLLFLYIFIFPESPRWLISVGRIQEAKNLIKEIAKSNGTELVLTDYNLDETLERLVLMSKDKNELENANGNNDVGIWTLFSRRNLAKNTILLTLSLIVNSFIYDGITLNTPNIPGDQFFNFFLLAMIEIPANFLGGWLVERYGRRWIQVIFLGISGLSCFIAMFAIMYPALSIVVTISILVSKFAITTTYLVIALQLTELFPTPLRSTGNSFAASISGIVALGSPGMVYLGHFYAPSPYIIMGSMATIVMISSMFLPETLRQHLPETIEAADNFGKGNKFWSIKPKQKKCRIKI